MLLGKFLHSFIDSFFTFFYISNSLHFLEKSPSKHFFYYLQPMHLQSLQGMQKLIINFYKKYKVMIPFYILLILGSGWKTKYKKTAPRNKTKSLPVSLALIKMASFLCRTRFSIRQIDKLILTYTLDNELNSA